jgi:uncharacterized protein
MFIADVPSAIVCLLGAIAQIFLGRRLRIPAAVNVPLAIFALCGYFVVRESRSPTVWRLVPPVAHTVIPPTIAVWFFGLACTGILVLLRDAIPPFKSGRREFLRKSTALLCVTPAAALGIAIIKRKDFRINEIDLPFPGLASDLHGLKLLQLSDIHLGSFYGVNDLSRVIDASNNLKADIAFITGDLITLPWDPLDKCLVELRRLRASLGVWGCMGNHEHYCRLERYVQIKASQFGIGFLRQQAAFLTVGASRLNLVGVDYQPFDTPYLVDIEPLLAVGSFNLLLSHNPDVFPVAAQKGFDLTLAGHTHGGQVNVEILRQNLNVTRFYTPYTKGLYNLPTSSLYVNSGLGTIGMPVRIGAPPEITLIRLRRSA